MTFLELRDWVVRLRDADPPTPTDSANRQLDQVAQNALRLYAEHNAKHTLGFNTDLSEACLTNDAVTQTNQTKYLVALWHLMGEHCFWPGFGAYVVEHDELVTDSPHAERIGKQIRSYQRESRPAQWKERAEHYAAALALLADRAGEGARNENTHGPDFRDVTWQHTKYLFTPKQAACVRVLWEAWEQGTPWTADGTVLQKASVGDRQRLRDVFKNHAAWGTMIVQGPQQDLHGLQEFSEEI